MTMDSNTYESLLLIFKDELHESHAALLDALLKIEKADPETLQKLLQSLFRTAHNIKGAAKSVSLPSVATLAHQLEDKFSEWREGKHTPSQKEINFCLTMADELLITFQSATKKNSDINEILKIPLDRIENANTKADEFIIYRLRLENILNQLSEIAVLSDETKSIHREFYEHLLSDIHEKIIKIVNDSENFLGEFSRSLQELQDHLRSMRLVPISTILLPLKRSASDLGLSLQKNVTLKTIGDDIEMDKAILDLIKDPLQHLLRNAIDHGIESPEKRKEFNKPENAVITITIEQVSGKIKIIFSDDGHGIDIARVKLKAINENFIKNADSTELTDQQALQFIFKPGFTTSEKVTEVSGRGVGLDVVASSVEKAKGSISVDTQLNKGTAFTLMLPLTMATTRGVFITLNDQSYMLPSLSIGALYNINPDLLKSVESETVYVVDHHPVPVRKLNQLLQLESNNLIHYQGIYINDAKTPFILLVDKIENEQDCVIKPLPPPFNGLKLYIGITLTGSNTLVPVLDTRVLIEIAKKTILQKSNTVFDTHTKNVKRHILIVDDSITTRSLSANALRASGFEVTTFADGRTAWQFLQKQPVYCVVSDIEMPYMNGYELTKLIKSDNTLKKVHVIIVSGHESEEEQKQAINSGSDAFLVKSQFNTRSLIDLIESFS